jgi:hypothetical protein
MFKKTLLITSALASAALISTASFAELKVSGSQEWEIGQRTQDTTSTDGKRIGSLTVFGFSGGGDLGNGNSYKVAYALEQGAHDTVQANLKFGAIDIELGANGSIGNEDVKALLPYVNNRFADIAGAGFAFDVDDISSGDTYIGLNVAAGSAGAISLGYNPNRGNASTQTTDNYAATSVSTGSAYSASFKGSLGVDGLTVGVGIMEGNNAAPLKDDEKSLSYGASYNMGKVAVGYQWTENTLGTGLKATTTAEEENKQYGVSFAASDSVSIGLYQAKSKTLTEGVSSKETTSNLLSVGYKLGAAKVSYDYITADNFNQSATNDASVHKVKLMMAF